LQEYRRRVPLLRRLLEESLRNPELSAGFYRTFIVQGRQLFTEFLNERRKLGELRSDRDVEAAAAVFLAALPGPRSLVEVFGGSQVEPLDHERLLESLSDVFLRGLRSI
jgi:hypothetical protein